MYKELLRSIEAIEIFPVISLVIFFTFFIMIVYWAMHYDNKFVRKMSDLPLENDHETLIVEQNTKEH